ncbi:MAG: hypothetical protein LCH91_05430 [Bacteroidetes bacterium]|nr:hypothetical protein [Bacteroidota bacterium]
MNKKLVIGLPAYLKKFYVAEYGGEQVEKAGKVETVIRVEKSSELGKLIHLVARPILTTQCYPKPETDETLTLLYYSRKKSYVVPAEKVAGLVKQMEEIFRRTIICEVRGVHEESGTDYGKYLARCLERRGIEKDIDVDFDNIRKIYRDYIQKVERKNQNILD